MGEAGESQRVTDMVKSALSLGYRHIDTVRACFLVFSMRQISTYLSF